MRLPVSIIQVKINLRKDPQHQFLSKTCRLRQVHMHPHAHTHIPIIKSAQQTHSSHHQQKYKNQYIQNENRILVWMHTERASIVTAT